jgi:hypothetical protein
LNAVGAMRNSVWKPEYETVIQVSRREKELYQTRDKNCVFHKYHHPVGKGIHHSGEFPVAVVRLLYEALGFKRGFQVQPSRVQPRSAKILTF